MLDFRLRNSKVRFFRTPENWDFRYDFDSLYLLTIVRTINKIKFYFIKAKYRVVCVIFNDACAVLRLMRGFDSFDEFANDLARENLEM